MLSLIKVIQTCYCPFMGLSFTEIELVKYDNNNQNNNTFIIQLEIVTFAKPSYGQKVNS